MCKWYQQYSDTSVYISNYHSMTCLLKRSLTAWWKENMCNSGFFRTLLGKWKQWLIFYSDNISWYHIIMYKMGLKYSFHSFYTLEFLTVLIITYAIWIKEHSDFYLIKKLSTKLNLQIVHDCKPQVIKVISDTRQSLWVTMPKLSMLSIYPIQECWNWLRNRGGGLLVRFLLAFSIHWLLCSCSCLPVRNGVICFNNQY